MVSSLAAKGFFAMFLLGSVYVIEFYTFTKYKLSQSQFKKAEQGGYISSKRVVQWPTLNKQWEAIFIEQGNISSALGVLHRQSNNMILHSPSNKLQ